MQIIILHGDDTVKSYERLTKFTNEAKKRGWQITDYNFQEVTNQTLFDENKFYVLYDYKLLNKKIIEKLEKYSGNLIIYHASKISAVALRNLNADKTELFELPVVLWKFLDNMTVTGLHELLKTQAVEYILAMMAWKLKQKYLTKPTPGVGQMILELAEIDVKSKTGKADLLLSLDLLLTKHLK